LRKNMLAIKLCSHYDRDMVIRKQDHVKHGAEGGKARAAALSSSDRSEIARRAAEARWGRQEQQDSLLPKETHIGTIKVGDREIPCSVLENSIRVFSARGIHRVMGSKPRGGKREPEPGGAVLPSFLASPGIKSFIPEDLMVALISPIQYRPKHGGRTAFGYNAVLLPQICEVILDAEKGGAAKAKPLAEMAGILLRAFARVGVIALVDEATGYQQDRARDELNRILEAYISKELMPWTKRFPDEFFRQVYRLHDWEYKQGVVKSPRYLGKVINRTVYEQMPPGVLEELRRLNPKTEAGYRKVQHHRLLTPDTGHPHLDKQIVAVTTLMRVADNKEYFWDLFDRAFPKKGQQMKLEYGENEPLEIEE
jgi:P63C domain